jgi:hypothetical protein
LGSLFPTASHLKVAPDACAGRLLMMEHEVKSIFNIERTFNSYLSDFVSHLGLALMVGEDPLFQDFENLFVGIIMGATLIHEFLEPAYFKNCFKES